MPPCYNNIYQLISLLYALSHIVLSSQGGLLPSTIDIDRSNHIGVDNNNDRFERRRSNVRVQDALIQESTADPSSSPSTILIVFPSTIPTIESSNDLSPSEAGTITSDPSKEPPRSSDSPVIIFIPSNSSMPSSSPSNSSIPSSIPSNSSIPSSSPPNSSIPSSIPTDSPFTSSSPSNSSIPSSSPSDSSMPSSSPSDSSIPSSIPSDSSIPSSIPSDSSIPSSIPSNSSIPSSSPSNSSIPSSNPTDSSIPSSSPSNSSIPSSSPSDSPITTSIPSYLPIIPSSYPSDPPITTSNPSNIPTAISSGYVVTYFEVRQILYGINSVDYTQDSTIYDSILKKTISSCMLRDNEAVENIDVEDFIASSTSAVLVVRYSSSSDMITLSYKVKSNFIDSSYTILSNNLIRSITDGHFNTLLRQFGNHTLLYLCTSDSATTIDLLQVKNKYPSNDNDSSNSSRLPDSTIAVIIIAVMMCLLLITGGLYYYFHLLSNADSTADQDINAEFILHQSMENSCIQTTTYRFKADESPAIVANPMYRHPNV